MASTVVFPDSETTSLGEFKHVLRKDRSFTAFRMTMWALSVILNRATNLSYVLGIKEQDMANEAHEPSQEEVALMLKHNGLTLPAEQLETFCIVVARLEAAACRLRKGLNRNDEPASAFLRR